MFDVAAGERSSSACQDSSRHPSHVRLLSTPTLHVAHCAPIVVADDQLSVCGSGLTAVTIQTLYYLNHLRRLGSASCPNLPSAESHSLLLCLTEQTHAHLLVLAHLGQILHWNLTGASSQHAPRRLPVTVPTNASSPSKTHVSLRA